MLLTAAQLVTARTALPRLRLTQPGRGFRWFPSWHGLGQWCCREMHLEGSASGGNLKTSVASQITDLHRGFLHQGGLWHGLGAWAEAWGAGLQPQHFCRTSERPFMQPRKENHPSLGYGDGTEMQGSRWALTQELSSRWNHSLGSPGPGGCRFWILSENILSIDHPWMLCPWGSLWGWPP